MKTALYFAGCWAVGTMMAAAADFHVSPGGSDENPGTLNKPFSTFYRAQAAVRAERTLHTNEGVTVYFLAGRYELDRPVQFDASDSGASLEHPVRYVAEPGAKVELSGGYIIKDWQKDPYHKGVWKTRVITPNYENDVSWRFEQLWVNGKRAVRARTPNYWSFNTLKGVSEEPRPMQSWRRLTLTPSNLKIFQL